jgi:ABC-type amino acid transport substrate-binding protein
MQSSNEGFRLRLLCSFIMACIVTVSVIAETKFPIVQKAGQRPEHQAKVLRFASGTQSHPFSLIEGNEVSGIYKDILDSAFSHLGYKVSVTTHPPARVLTELKNGGIDLFPHFEIGSLIKFQDIPNTVVCNKVLFSVKMSLFSLRSLDRSKVESKAYRVGWVRYHYIPSKLLEEYIPYPVSFSYTSSYSQLVKLLLAGRVEYVISAMPNFYSNYKRLGGDAEVLEENLFPSARVRLGFSTLTLGDEAKMISQSFCDQVGRMLEDGSIDRILSKYSKLEYFDKS